MSGSRNVMFTIGFCILFAVCISGCRSEAAGGKPDDRHNETGQRHSQQRQCVEDYISKMSPLLQDHGFPNIRLEPIEEDGSWRIRVKGTVVSTSEEEGKDSPIVLESVLRASNPPAELQMEVEYQVR